MFEVPDAKRIRRDELYGSSSDAEDHSQADAEEDAEIRAKLNERLSSLLGLDLSSSAAAQPADAEQPAEPPQEAGADQEEKAEEEFEFRLFSTSSKAAAPVKVVLAASDDEDADLGDGAFTVPERPSSYYFAGQPTPEQLQMFRQSALAGDDIVLGARKRAWGLERPWRIIKIGGPTKSIKRPSSVKGPDVKVASAATSIVNEGDEQKRKRPGKKRRIATRVKAKAEKEKREAAEKQKMTKEEHLKEKKKRLNREKKLKRRAKEREQKLADKGQAGGSQQTVSNPADSGSDDDSAA